MPKAPFGERITIQNKCYEINSLYRWIITRNNEILPGSMKSITYEEKKRLIQAYEELQIHDFKMFINKNTIKTKNLKKSLNVYTFDVPRDDFNDVLYMIIDAIKLFQPNPEIYGRSDMPMYYREHPERYPEYKQNIISYVKFHLSEDNVMLPILENFDYVRWSGRYRQLENLADIMINDIVNKLGFDGLGRKYGGEVYFYRTESMK